MRLFFIRKYKTASEIKMTVNLKAKKYLPFVLCFILGLGLGAFLMKNNGSINTQQRGFFEFNESAPIAKIAGRDFALQDLSSNSRFLLNQKILELSELAFQSAKRQAALVLHEKNNDWRNVLAEALSTDALEKEYSRQTSFQTTGSFSEVALDVENYIYSKEVGLRTEKWFESIKAQQLFKLAKVQLLSVETSQLLDNLPFLVIGDENAQMLEAAVIYQYSGGKLSGMMSELQDFAKRNNVAFKLKLQSLFTHHPFDQRATEILACASRLQLSQKSISDLNQHFISVAPQSVWSAKAGTSLAHLNSGLASIDSRLQGCEMSGEQKKDFRGQFEDFFRVTQARQPMLVINSQEIYSAQSLQFATVLN
jgi:hypothetical protein